MKKIKILLILLTINLFAYHIDDTLHGFSVNLPDNYLVHASSKTGKILIIDKNYKNGVSIFLLKNPKTKEKEYLLKILSLPIKSNIYYKIEKNKIVAKTNGAYISFGQFFNTGFIQYILYNNLAYENTDCLITISKGEKYSLVTAFLYENRKNLKNLQKIVKSLKFKKPTTKYENRKIYSLLNRKLVAFYADLPNSFQIKNSFYLTRVGEFAAILAKDRENGVFVGNIINNYLYSTDPYNPYLVSTIIDYKTGQEIPLQNIFSSDKDFIYFIIDQFTDIKNYSIKYITSNTNPFDPSNIFNYYRLKSNNLFGDITIGKKESFLGNAQAGSLTATINLAWGKDLGKSIGALISFEMNPKWFSESLKIMTKEAKSELEHQRWMWSEFRKTRDYIEKLHKHSMRQEQIFQEEMARALTNILSDYTYAKDPETGEVFHLKDEFDQYWRTKEGDIIGISGQVDERALEAEGFRKLQIRLEGFGQW